MASRQPGLARGKTNKPIGHTYRRSADDRPGGVDEGPDGLSFGVESLDEECFKHHVGVETGQDH